MKPLLFNRLNLDDVYKRGTLISIHIADLHFGVKQISPKTEYDILDEQFFPIIENIYFDILSINGDLFDSKCTSYSEDAQYASIFFSRCVRRCKQIGATLVIIEGTEKHDAHQLSLFYHYLDDKELDLRIVNQVQFEYIKNARILCIPEMYNMGEDYYNYFLKDSGLYDAVFMHGMLEGAVYTDKNDLGKNTSKAPVFNIHDFDNCKGYIASGHVHTPGCFNKRFYYCGSPMRYKHGEESEKGFFIILHNLDTQYHYAHFQPIKSFLYKTLFFDDIIKERPEVVLQYINDLMYKENIHNLRIQFNRVLNPNELDTLVILKTKLQGNKNINIDYNSTKKTEEQKMNGQIDSNYKEYSFIFDKNDTYENKFVNYVNKKEGHVFITVEDFKKILEDENWINN